MNLDIFWLKDKSLEDSEDLPETRCPRPRNRRRSSNGVGTIHGDSGGVAGIGHNYYGQPHAEAIMRGVRTSEYRSRATRIRGRIHIYASPEMDL